MPVAHAPRSDRLAALCARWHTEPLPAPGAPATATALLADARVLATFTQYRDEAEALADGTRPRR